MKIYITRHGQVLTWENFGDAQFPAGDPPLSETGREQASRLGAYMKHLGFTGTIYSSPYARAMETAQLIAEHTGSRILPWSPMREITKNAEDIKDFVGMTQTQILENYPNAVENPHFPYPWWVVKSETADDVIARVKAGIAALPTHEDVLLVGHGASIDGACRALEIPRKGGDGFNCCLSIHDTEDPRNFKFMDGSHLPYAMRTFNSVIKSEEDQKLLQPLLDAKLDIPLHPESTRILHISDTATSEYPYVEKAIRELRPHIIIHTGDFVDEVKAGRMPGTEEEYIAGIRRIAEILKNSGAEKIYVVPGNNDILSVMEQELAFAELVTPNSIVNICGINCALGHTCRETIAPAQWSFYGHGLSGETWSPDRNELQNGVCRFNAVWGYSLIQLPQKTISYLPKPQKYQRVPR